MDRLLAKLSACFSNLKASLPAFTSIYASTDYFHRNFFEEISSVAEGIPQLRVEIKAHDSSAQAFRDHLEIAKSQESVLPVQMRHLFFNSKASVSKNEYEFEQGFVLKK